MKIILAITTNPDAKIKPQITIGNITRDRPNWTEIANRRIPGNSRKYLFFKRNGKPESDKTTGINIVRISSTICS